MTGCRFYTAVVLLLTLSIFLSESKKAGDILDCIQKKVPVIPLTDLKLENICTSDKEDKECPKTVLGMYECFILNECYNKNLNDDVIFVLN